MNRKLNEDKIRIGLVLVIELNKSTRCMIVHTWWRCILF